jgi:pimeloyl-ACP methyl ester carboxylesterase
MPFAITQQGRLYYEAHDLTPPWTANPAAIVFHHGAAANLHLWHDWLPHFCTGYRLIVLDARGCGHSSVPPLGFEWSLERLTGDVLEVTQAAGVNRFHFIGEDVGGLLGLFLAIKYGDRLLSLTVASCAARYSARGADSWRALIETRGQQAWAEQMMEWRYFPNALRHEQHEWWLRQHASCNARAALAMHELAAESDLTAQLAAIRTPTLLLAPDASPFVPAAHMAELQTAIPGAELQAFAHARHGLPVSHATACAEATSAFLARHFTRFKSDLPVVI